MVTETFPPEINGVAHTVATVVSGLRARSHDVEVVRPFHRAGHSAQDRSDVETVGWPIPMYPQLSFGLPARRRLHSLWRNRRPDIVHVATEGPLGWSAISAARSLGIPVCTDFRTNFDAYCDLYGVGWLRSPVTRYLRSFHKRGQTTLVPTESQRDRLARSGFEHLLVMGRGVDTHRFTPSARSLELRRNWGLTKDSCAVLYVGRLAPEKNLGLLADAFDAMKAVNPGAKLVVVGDGPERAHLQSRCPSAVFTGFRTGPDLAAHYASADAFVFPSQSETFGNVTLEAMSSGLPVLAYDDAAASKLIRHGVNGLLANRGNELEFIELASMLAADKTAHSKFGMAARDTAAHHGWDTIVTSLEELYADLVVQSMRGSAGG